MKLVIAEKPMLARDIARAICGRSERYNINRRERPCLFFIANLKKVLTRCVPYGMIKIVK